MRLVKAIGLAATVSLAAIAFFGVFSANAEGPVLHINLCRHNNMGTGQYEDSACKKITGVFLWESVGIGSTPKKVKSKGTKEFELETGTALIKCTTESSAGTALNPEPVKTTNGEGKATITFEGCVFSKPLSCSIPGKKVVTKELRGVVEESKTFGVGVKLTPVSGTVFAEISAGEECALGETLSVKGSVFGKASSTESVLEFTNESSALTLGASAAKLRGGARQEEEEKGNALLAAP